MGVALADAAAEYGATVDLVLGPVNIFPGNRSVNVIHVTTAKSMSDACVSLFPSCDAAILAAAVADFSPVQYGDRKLKREGEGLVLKLIPTTDIAAALGKMKTKYQLLAGFALETHDEMTNATAKLKRKNLDLIVLNSLKDQGAGFGYDTNKITIIDRYNNINTFELKSKADNAKDILDKIVSMLNLPQE